MDPDELEIRSIRARVRQLASGAGYRFEERRRSDGFQLVLTSERDPEETFIAIGPRGGGYVSVSLLLVVEEEFIRTSFEGILDVTSQFDVCASLMRDPRIGEGEVYLSLALRLFQEGLGEATFRMALENLRETREALAEAFP